MFWLSLLAIGQRGKQLVRCPPHLGTVIFHASNNKLARLLSIAILLIANVPYSTTAAESPVSTPKIADPSNPAPAVVDTFVVNSLELPPRTTDKYYETTLDRRESNIRFEGVDLFVPSDAVTYPVKVRMVRLSDATLPPLSPGMINVTAMGGGYQLLPDKLILNTPATIQLPIRDDLIDDKGQLSANAQTFLWDDTQQTWIPIEKLGINRNPKRIISPVSDFGTMINAILTAPDSPPPLQFNPNTIKDFAAVEPTANVDLIQPPVANNNGTAELNFPLRLPAGRGAYSPQLTLSYSSERGNGWMGLGWDIAISRIEIDTRWGVPAYDGSERYMLDGAALVPVSLDATARCKANSDDLPLGQYSTRIESFQRILRCGSENNFWWEVTSKDGTRFEYGHGDEARLTSSDIPGSQESGRRLFSIDQGLIGELRQGPLSASLLKQFQDNSILLTLQARIIVLKAGSTWVIMDGGEKYIIESEDQTLNVYKGTKAAIWYLERVIDTNRNSTTFTYTLDKHADGEPSTQIYPDAIEYTSHPNLGARYRIEFVRQNCNRPDPIVSARLGFVVLTRCLLNEVNIYFLNSGSQELIRGYTFDYFDIDESTSFPFAYKSLLEKVQTRGRNANEFYEHTFEYSQPSFSQTDGGAFVNTFESTTLQGPEPDGRDDYLLSYTSQKAHDLSVSGSIGVGLGAGTDATSVGCKVSVTAGTSWEFPKPMMRQADITGDGVIDQVWVNERGTQATDYYGDQFFEDVPGLISVGQETSAGNLSLGAGAGCNVSSLSVNAGVSYSTRKESTNSILADANGDGLTDLTWGTGYRPGMSNYCRGGEAPDENGECEDGLPACGIGNYDACFGSRRDILATNQFHYTSLSNTSKPLNVNGAIDISPANSTAAQGSETPFLEAERDWGPNTTILRRLTVEKDIAQAENSDEVPDLSHYRPVIRWDAAHDGTIRLAVTARRKYLLHCENDPDCDEGVRVTLLRAQNGHEAGATQQLGELTIGPAEAGWFVVPGTGTIQNVRFGESFLVLVDALTDIPVAHTGEFIDEVELNILVEYEEVCPPGQIGCYSITTDDLDRRDANGQLVYRFQYPADFRLSELPKVSYWQLLPPIGPPRVNPDGTVDHNQVTGVIKKSKVTDSPVHVRVRCESVISQQANDSNICPMGTILAEEVFSPEELGTREMTVPLPDPFHPEYRAIGFMMGKSPEYPGMGFLWNPNGTSFYPMGHFYGGSNSVASGGNELGHIVGLAHSPSGTYAVIWTPEQGLQSLGIQGNALALNNQDFVVGRGSPNGPSEQTKPFLWSPDAGLSVLEIPEAYAGIASDINERNQVAGIISYVREITEFTRIVQQFAFVWDDTNFDGQVNDHEYVVLPSINELPKSLTQHIDHVKINDQGYVIGNISQFNSRNHPGYTSRPFVWQDTNNNWMADEGELIMLSENSRVYDINDQNQIVGSMTIAGELHAVLWENNSITKNWEPEDLGASQIAFAINDNGNILARTVRRDPEDRSLIQTFLIFPDRTTQNLTDTIGQNAIITDITSPLVYEPIRLMYEIDGENGSEIPPDAIDWNPSLEIISMYDLGKATIPYKTQVLIEDRNDEEQVQSFIWEIDTASRQTSQETVPSLSESISIASSLNSSGHVVGTSITNEGEVHAFLWIPENDRLIDIGSCSTSPFGIALDINNQDQVAGVCVTFRTDLLFPLVGEAFLWDPLTRKIQNLHQTGGLDDGSKAFLINDHGTIIGTQGNRHFIFDGATFNNLEDIIQQSPEWPAGWGIQSIVSINNNNWILGSQSRDRIATFVWTNENEIISFGQLPLENFFSVLPVDLNNLNSVTGFYTRSPEGFSNSGSFIWQDTNLDHEPQFSEIHNKEGFKVLAMSEDSQLVGSRLNSASSELVLWSPIYGEQSIKLSGDELAAVDIANIVKSEAVTATRLNFFPQESMWQQELPVLYRVHPSRQLTPFRATEDNLELHINTKVTDGYHPLFISILGEHFQEVVTWSIPPTGKVPFDTTWQSFVTQLPKAGLYYIRGYTEASFDVNTAISLDAELFGPAQIVLVHRDRAKALLGRIPLLYSDLNDRRAVIWAKENSAAFEAAEREFPKAQITSLHYPKSTSTQLVLQNFIDTNDEVTALIMDTDIYDELIKEPRVRASLADCCSLASAGTNGRTSFIPRLPEISTNLLLSDFGGGYDAIYQDGITDTQLTGEDVSKFLDQVGEVWYSFESFGGGHHGFFYAEYKSGLDLTCVGPYPCGDQDGSVAETGDAVEGSAKTPESPEGELAWRFDIVDSTTANTLDPIAYQSANSQFSTHPIESVTQDTVIANSVTVDFPDLQEQGLSCNANVTSGPVHQGLLIKDLISSINDLNTLANLILVPSLQYSLLYSDEKFPLALKQYFEIRELNVAINTFVADENITAVLGPVHLLEPYEGDVIGGVQIFLYHSDNLEDQYSCLLDSDKDGIFDCRDNCPNDPINSLDSCCVEICQLLSDCNDPACYTDSDHDGTADCMDKYCEIDSDKDGIVDCQDDLCSRDSNGDGVFDCDDPLCFIDSNSDGVVDCRDPLCDKDSDGDGIVDCEDPVPMDVELPSVSPPEDHDHDGVPSAEDECPFAPGIRNEDCPPLIADRPSISPPENPNEKPQGHSMSPILPGSPPGDGTTIEPQGCFYGSSGSIYFCNDGSTHSGSDEISSRRKRGDGGRFDPPPDLQRSTTSSFNASLSIGINLGNLDPTGFTDVSLGPPSKSAGSTWSDLDYMDWNGDGLPDSISPNIITLSGSGERILLSEECYYPNEGDCIIYPTIRDYVNLTEGSSTFAGPIPIFKLKENAKGQVRTVGWGDLGFGFNSHLNISSLLVERADMNGDGLPDIVIGRPGSSYGSVQVLVCLNLVYRIGECEPWGTLALYNYPYSKIGSLASVATGRLSKAYDDYAALSQSESISFGTDIGVSFKIDILLIAFGFKGGRSANNTTTQSRIGISDINGDGLVDFVLKNPSSNRLLVFFNSGMGFQQSRDPAEFILPNWEHDPIIGNHGDFPSRIGLKLVNEAIGDSPDALQLSGSETTVYSGELEARFLIFGSSVAYGYSKGGNSSEMGFYDVTGDGLPDRVLRTGNETHGDVIQVQENRLGGTNLLTTVNRPFGGQIILEYEPNTPTELDPSTRWLLTHVEQREDPNFANPYSESPGIENDFEYEEPFYDRYEREFLGFRQVRSIRLGDGQITEELYINRDYWLKGTLESSTVFKETGTSQAKYLEMMYETELDRKTSDNALWNSCLDKLKLPLRYLANDTLKNQGKTPCDVHFARPVSMVTRHYEGGEQYQETIMRYEEYDNYGNLTRFRDEQNAGTTDDDLVALVSYTPVDAQQQATFQANYIFDRAFVIEVHSVAPNGELLRYRRGEYDDLGNLLKHGTLNVYSPNVNLSTTNILNDSSGLQVNLLTFGYDEFGYMTNVTDSLDYHVDYTPDDVVHMFATATTDSLGLTSSAGYNFAFQLPELQEDVNRHSLVMTYDEFGRLETVQGPFESNAEEDSLNIVYSPLMERTSPRFAITTNNAVDPRIDPRGSITDPLLTSIRTAIFVDGLGRIIQNQVDSEVNGNIGRTISGQIEFDGSGRILKQGQPRFVAGTTINPVVNAAIDARSTHWEYDTLDRVTVLTEPGNLRTSFIYDVSSAPQDNTLTTLRTQITDPEGKMRFEHYDAVTRLVAVVQRFEGEDLITSYMYLPTGELSSITDARDNVSNMEYDLAGRRIAITTPDTGRMEMAYDASGNLTAKTDQELCDTTSANLLESCSANQKILYEYDTASRLVLVNYPENGLEDIEYVYGDADVDNVCDSMANIMGRVCRVADGSGVERRSYDALGQMILVERTMQGAAWETNDQRTFVTQFTFDSFGRMLDVTYPDNEQLQYGYDAGGQVNCVSIGSDPTCEQNIQKYVQDIQYDEYGKRTKIMYGNGVVTDYQYESDTHRLEISTIRASQPSLGDLRSLDYDYDDVGNITLITEQRPNNLGATNIITRVYGYDDLRRLGNFTYETVGPQGADGSSPVLSSVTGSFGYDTVGNITSQIVQRTDGTSPLAAYPSRSWDYEYTNNDRPNLPAAIGPYTYSYDNRGAITSSPQADGSDAPVGMSYTWDEEGRLENSQSQGSDDRTTYSYNDEGQRTRKQTVTDSRSDTTIYPNEFYTVRFARQTGNSCSGTTICWENQVSTSKHIYIGQERFAAIAGVVNVATSPPEGLPQLTVGTGNQVVQYFHPDLVGSTMLTTNATGDLAVEIDYLPFGEVLEEQNHDGTLPQAFRFNGKELDQETGLVYFGVRYYDPKIGRWINADKLFLIEPEQGQAKPQMLNLHAFSLSNPVRLADLTGQKPAEYTFNTPRQAALRALKDIWVTARVTGWEWGGMIYKNPDGTYSYTTPRTDQLPNTVDPWVETVPGEPVASYHTHPKGENFSDWVDKAWIDPAGRRRGDKEYANFHRINAYLATPMGDFLTYDWANDKETRERGIITPWVNWTKMPTRQLRSLPLLGPMLEEALWPLLVPTPEPT